MALKQRPRICAVRDYPPGCGPNAVVHHHEPEDGVVEEEGKPVKSAGPDAGRPKRKRPFAVRDFPVGCGPNRPIVVDLELEEGWGECDGGEVVSVENAGPDSDSDSDSGRPEKRRAVVAMGDFPPGYGPEESEFPDSYGVVEYEEDDDVEGEDSVCWPPRKPAGFGGSRAVGGGDDGGDDDGSSEEVSSG